MKRFITAFLVIAAIQFFSFSEESSKQIVNFFTFEKPDFYITQQFEYNLMYDARSENSGMSTIAIVDANELLGIGGFSSNSKRTDIALQLYYAPCLWNFFSIGLTTKYHYYKYSDEFAEHNTAAGFFTRFNIKNYWNLYLNMSYLWKSTIINTVPRIRFTERSVLMGTGAIFCPDEFWKFYADISSYSFFDDALIGSPVLDTGFMRKVWLSMSCGASFYAKWIDASVLQEGLIAMGFKINWSIKF